MAPAPPSLALPPMQRFLIGLTLVLLLIVSIGIGMAVARWPQWRHPALRGPDPSIGVSIGGAHL